MLTSVALAFDGGGDYGIGNIIRSLALAQHMQSAGFIVHLLPLSESAADLANVAEGTSCFAEAEVVVLDVPYLGDYQAKRFHALGKKCLALDYRGTYAPDMTVNLQSQHPSPVKMRGVCGLEYAIIRRELFAYRGYPTTSTECLVMIGGGDRTSLCGEILAKLQGIHRGICLVQGPNTKHPVKSSPHVRVITNQNDIEVSMANCQWAVTTAGTTMLELLYLGRAVHVVPRTTPELTFATKLNSFDALLGVGLRSLRAPNPNRVTEVTDRGMDLIDGRGWQRIAAILESMIR